MRKRIITRDDFIDLYVKIKERGYRFVLTKLSPQKLVRTKSAFNDATEVDTSNLWIIPAVRKRWNYKISGNPDTNYIVYFKSKYINENDSLKMLSLGSGSCNNELMFASYPQLKEIVCVDVSNERLKEGELSARNRHLNNIQFICEDFNKYPFPESYFDVVLFNLSLHHTDDVSSILKNKVKKTLKPHGRLIINEYVGPNRMQFDQEQIRAINKGLILIDQRFRVRHKTSLIKKKYYGSGIVRMIMADPSEAKDSSRILPVIHEHFKIIEEKPYGGNILMGVLKDISHHFVDSDQDKEKTELLNKLFFFEDQYLSTHPTDFIFGVYEKEDDGSHTFSNFHPF